MYALGPLRRKVRPRPKGCSAWLHDMHDLSESTGFSLDYHLGLGDSRLSPSFIKIEIKITLFLNKEKVCGRFPEHITEYPVQWAGF